MKFVPIQRKRLSESAIEQIREFIIANKMQPGDRLPSEKEMIAQLGVGRVSIREALRMLEITGIVEVRPGRGVFVKELTGDLFIPLGSWVSMHKQTLQQHFETRLILEPEIAALAANYAGADDIQRLNDAVLLQKDVEEGDLVGAIRFDIEFHCYVAEATRNKDVAMVMNTIAKYSFEGWKAALRTVGRNRDVVVEHAAIIDALVRKDPGRARSAMRDHLEESVRRLEKQGFENRGRDKENS
jgi:GntR family transcriptional repressor for pyruvate dehydrogenase complex